MLGSGRKAYASGYKLALGGRVKPSGVGQVQVTGRLQLVEWRRLAIYSEVPDTYSAGPGFEALMTYLFVIRDCVVATELRLSAI